MPKNQEQNNLILPGEVKPLKQQLTFKPKKNELKDEGKISNCGINDLKNIFANKLDEFKKHNNQSNEILKEFNTNAQSKRNISRYLEESMSKGIIPIGCPGKKLWSDFLDYATMIAETEKIVLEKMENNVKHCENFISWNDVQSGDDNMKLTLIFNSFGLSQSTINVLGPNLNGLEFIDEDIFDICFDYSIDWETALDLSYIQMNLRNNTLPCFTHFQNCPVCCCSTPQDLENLLKEHEINLDFTLLKRKNINGPRFIGNSAWLRRCGENIDQNQFRSAIQQMKQLHNSDL